MLGFRIVHEPVRLPDRFRVTCATSADLDKAASTRWDIATGLAETHGDLDSLVHPDQTTLTPLKIECDPNQSVRRASSGPTRAARDAGT